MSVIDIPAVADAEIAAFRDDGAVCLRGLFGDWVETLRQGVERNIAAPSADVKLYDGSRGGRLLRRLLQLGPDP